MTHGRDVSLFDRFAHLYDLGMPSADPEALNSGLTRAGRPIDRIVEVGGGTGRVAREMDATVIDAARGMLLEGLRHGVTGIQGDAGALPLRDQSVDAVLIVDALHHFPARRAALREASRVLAPDGVVVVRDFDPTTLRGRGLILAERLVGFNSQFWSPDDLVTEMRRNGLEPEVAERGFTYTVVGLKTREPGPDREE